jgi:hypothetical protein
MARSGWTQWDEEQARHELREWRESGEAADVFAGRRGYSKERLRRWDARLNRRATLALLPVRILAKPLRLAPPLEVVLRGGRVLRVLGEFDKGQLGELLQMLEALPC